MGGKKKKVVTSSCLRVLSFHIHLVLNDSISAAVFFQGSNVGFCVAERVPKARPPISGGVNKHRYIILRQIYMYIYINCVYICSATCSGFACVVNQALHLRSEGSPAW